MNQKKLLMIALILGWIVLGACSKSKVKNYPVPNFPSYDTTSTQLGPAPAGSPVARYGQLSVTGRYLTDEHGDTIALHGMSFGWSTWWPQYWNADVVSWLTSDWKVDVVRAAMGVDSKPGYLNDQTNQTKLMEKVVNAAINNGIYVLIDWHSSALHPTEASAFFAKMAQKYHSYPNIIYEIVNEPDNTISWPQVKTYAQSVIPQIRKYDKKNIILVGCPYWDQKIREVANSPLKGYSDIMYTVHFYAATHGQWLRDDCAYALGKGIPVFISECSGTEANGSGHIDYTQWNAWWDFCETNKLSWIDWDVADKSGELCSVLQPGASADGGWATSQLTVTGNYVRNKLRSYYSTK